MPDIGPPTMIIEFSAVPSSAVDRQRAPGGLRYQLRNRSACSATPRGDANETVACLLDDVPTLIPAIAADPGDVLN